MAGITGKNALSIKKLDVKESKVPAIGFNKIRFLHKASVGDQSITLSGLVTPSEATANGFVQPTITVLNSIKLSQFRENFTLKSSLRGPLMEYLAYRLVGANKITLLFSAEEGEIFEGIMDHNPRTGMSLVDGAPVVVTGVLPAGSTDFNVGVPFQVGMFPSAQHGMFMVMVEGDLVYRNSGNNPPGIGVSGDYYEVHAGGGLGEILRFTPDYVNDRQISVISIGSLIERPSGSQLALIEAIAGEVDRHREILEDVTDTEITPGAPSSVDLKAFGDEVFDHEVRIQELEHPDENDVWVRGPVTAGVTNTAILSFQVPIKNVGSAVLYSNDPTLGDSWTVQENGEYAIQFLFNENSSTQEAGISLNSTQLSTTVSTVTDKNTIIAIGSSIGVNILTGVNVTLPLKVGDIVRAHVATGFSTGANPEFVTFRIVKVGN